LQVTFRFADPIGGATSRNCARGVGVSADRAPVGEPSPPVACTADRADEQSRLDEPS
jgi:hypothetical protein